MASRRRGSQGRASNRKSVSAKGRGRASSSNKGTDIPTPYDDLLAEASQSPTAREDPIRPRKRRRIAPGEQLRESHTPDVETRSEQDDESPAPKYGPAQTVYEDSESSSASEMDWEEVDIVDNEDANDNEQKDVTANSTSILAVQEPSSTARPISDITIELDATKQTPSKSSSSRRLPSSAIEKRKRLDAHKVHLCCLLVHVAIRNAWCNDKIVQAALKPILSERTVSYLNPKETGSQFQRSRSIIEGLEQACDVFRPLFTIVARGLRRCAWSAEPLDSEKRRLPQDAEEKLNKDDFRRLAKSCEGSRDLGAQLFCALLRSVGVDARLVCSLQVLPFANPAPAPAPSSRDTKPTFELRDLTDHNSASELSEADLDRGAPDGHVDPSGSGLKPVRRFGSGKKAVDFGKAPPVPVKRKKIVESNQPIYWVEVFNKAIQKWLPVDLFATRTVGKPQKLEPPASDSSNSMSYVVAFEDDGTAKDVTRRYTKAYNAKTRRVRVEITKGGAGWWKRTMGKFQGPYEADRDQVEDAELTQKEASEPMPRNVQDFKDHPYYALERHLRRNEVIHPKKIIGKLSGNKASDTPEPIYRRRDVQLVKSADKWYREGREVMEGQQPLKYASSKPRRQGRSVSLSLDHNDLEDREDDESLGVGLYAIFQTQTYKPPAAAHGRVPKNAYGNLDIYVDTMIPSGTVHVQAAEAAKAAKILGLDYADAVTGFKFKGRTGTAITQGVIVAREYSHAMEETVKALKWQAVQEEAIKESRVALALWKRFLVGLRIRERIAAHDDAEQEDEHEAEDTTTEQVDEALEKEEEIQQEGGFIPDSDQTEIAQPTARHPQNRLGTTGPTATAGSSLRIPEHYDDTVTIKPSFWDSVPRVKYPTPARPAAEPESAIKNDNNNDGDDGDGGGGFFAASDAPPSPKQARKPTPDLFEEGSEKGDAEHQAGADTNEPDNEGGFIDAVPEAAKPEAESVGLDVTRQGTSAGSGKDMAGERDVPIDAGDVGRRNSSENGGDDEKDSDQASLLSHDPEDDEAEPDWL